jgi:membrane-associated protein
VEFVSQLLTGRYPLDELVRWGGYAGITAIVFAETGLLFGVLLPGDSLLITAGLLAGLGHFNVGLLMSLAAAAAIAGDSVGYAIGTRLGPALFRREKSLLFNPAHVVRTREFYARYGAKTIVIARFVPIVRTFAPLVAGVGQMAYRRFLAYNVAGGLGWVISMVGAGVLLGQSFPGMLKRIELLVFVVVVLSVVPIVLEVLRARRRRST